MSTILSSLMLAATLSIATPAAAEPVVVLVAIPIPAGMPREKLEAALRAAVPDYQHVPGLIRKYFTIGEDHRAGGIYLWSSRAAADAWYSDAWKAGVQKRWGAPASLSYFDVPALTDGQDPDGFKGK